MAIDENDHSYLVFSDAAVSGKITARKFDGTHWSNLGASGFSIGQASYNSIAVDTNNTPYVAFCDQGDGNKVIVKKFDGTNWIQVGLALSVAPSAYSSLVIDNNNVPYVAFKDGDNGNMVTVKKFDGTNWVLVGTAGFSNGVGSYVSLAIDQTNMPFVVYQDGGHGNKATVKKFDGTSWLTVGIEGFSVGSATYTDIAITSLGVPYVAYADAGDNNYANVKLFNGTVWETVDSPVYSALYIAAYTSITMDENDVPYLVFRVNSGTNAGAMVACKFDPAYSQWRYCSGNGSLKDVSYTNICVNSNGTPLVSYISSLPITMALVAKLNSQGYWRTLEAPGFSEGRTRGVATATAPDGTPYVAYLTNAYISTTTGGELAVKKFNGVDWEWVGNAIYGSNSITDFTITVDDNETPYVVFTYNGGISVRKFNGTTWVGLGTVSGSAGSYQCDIAINHNGVPYIAYRNGTDNRLSVKWYNETTDLWVNLTNTISTGAIYNPSIKIAPDNTPYVAFRDFSTGNKATVRKYVNNAWQTVGPAYSMSGGQVNYSDLAIDGNGTPYIIYQDYLVSQAATVKKFNGTNWVNVGAAGFTVGQARWTSITINESGVPYVVYEDISNGNKINVKKFDGTNWVQAGNPGFSSNPVGVDLSFRTVDIAIASSGEICAAYWNNGYTAAKKLHTSASYHHHSVCLADLPFQWNGDSYTSSGTYQHVFTNATGCDSTVNLYLTVNTPAAGTDTQFACDSFTWIDGNTYITDNNTATHTIPGGAANGCDSIVTLNLTIYHPTTGTDTQVACESFTWIDGNTYTQDNNIATYTLTNSHNCDSVVTLNLTILHGTSSTDTRTSCGPFTWINGLTYTTSNHSATHTLTGSNNCDSVVTLDLTVLPVASGIDAHFSCGPFTWINGVTYYSTNYTATHTIPNGAANGCDSIVTLNLMVSSINTTVTNNTTVLYSNHSLANSYEWFDCNSGELVYTGQTFHPTYNGSYKVKITTDNCVATSMCYLVNQLSLTDETINDLKIYPNPAKEILYVAGVDSETIQIRSLSGQELLSVSNQNNVNISNLASGCYLIEVNHHAIKMFSKE